MSVTFFSYSTNKIDRHDIFEILLTRRVQPYCKIRAHTDEEIIEQSEITPGQIFIRSF